MWNPPEEEQEDDFIVSARIHSIDQYGEVLIIFNVNMSTALVNITQMNSSFIDMYIEPYNNWTEGIDDFNMSKLNFTWNVTSYEGRKLFIKCNFFSPPTISPRRVFDNLVFHIKEKREFFRSLNEGVNIHDDFTTQKHKVKRQSAGDVGGGPEKIANTLMSLLLVAGIFSLLLSGAATSMIGLINGLQLIVHMPTHDVPFPSNVMNYLRAFVEITQFDVMPYFVRGWQKVFPGSFVDESLLEEDPEILNIWDQTQDLGYDSHVPVQLL